MVSTDIKYTFEERKFLWDVVKMIEEKMLDVDMIIRGSYLRDRITRDHQRKIFYRYCKESKIESHEQELKYGDITFHPESIDRLLMPSDIDCYTTDDNLSLLIQAVTELGFQMEETVIFDDGDYKTFKDISYSLKIYKYEISPLLPAWMKLLRDVTIPRCAVTLNVTVIQTESTEGLEELIFDYINKDKYCFLVDNIILMQNGFITINDALNYPCQDSINDFYKLISLVHKKETAILNFNDLEIIDMHNAGWTFTNNPLEFMNLQIVDQDCNDCDNDRSEDNDLHCSICLNSESHSKYIMYKCKKPCTNIMHVKCFTELLSSGKNKSSLNCLICNETILEKSEEVDATIESLLLLHNGLNLDTKDYQLINKIQI